jgi:hypothetical protein
MPFEQSSIIYESSELPLFLKTKNSVVSCLGEEQFISQCCCCVLGTSVQNSDFNVFSVQLTETEEVSFSRKKKTKTWTKLYLSILSPARAQARPRTLLYGRGQRP